MSFFLEEECKVDFEFDYKEIAQKVIDFCLEHEKFPYEAEINLTLTDNDGIWKINKEFRQIDRPTDVLSFPMLNYTKPGNFAFLITHSMLHLFGYDHMEEDEAKIMEAKQNELLDLLGIHR